MLTELIYELRCLRMILLEVEIYELRCLLNMRPFFFEQLSR